MTTKNGIIGAIIIAAVIIGAVMMINEANDGPLENAAEDIEDAANEVSDELDG